MSHVDYQRSTACPETSRTDSHTNDARSPNFAGHVVLRLERRSRSVTYTDATARGRAIAVRRWWRLVRESLELAESDSGDSHANDARRRTRGSACPTHRRAHLGTSAPSRDWARQHQVQ